MNIELVFIVRNSRQSSIQGFRLLQCEMTNSVVWKLEGKPHGRPKIAALKEEQIKGLYFQGYSKAKIARELDTGSSSVRRILNKE